MFTDLPIELKQMIIQKTDIETKKNINLVNSDLHKITQPYIDKCNKKKKYHCYFFFNIHEDLDIQEDLVRYTILHSGHKYDLAEFPAIKSVAETGLFLDPKFQRHLAKNRSVITNNFERRLFDRRFLRYISKITKWCFKSLEDNDTRKTMRKIRSQFINSHSDDTVDVILDEMVQNNSSMAWFGPSFDFHNKWNTRRFERQPPYFVYRNNPHSYNGRRQLYCIKNDDVVKKMEKKEVIKIYEMSKFIFIIHFKINKDIKAFQSRYEADRYLPDNACYVCDDPVTDSSSSLDSDDDDEYIDFEIFDTDDTDTDTDEDDDTD